MLFLKLVLGEKNFVFPEELECSRILTMKIVYLALILSLLIERQLRAKPL